MKFIHTSDWHIGASKFLPDYLERQEAVIDEIFSLAKERGIKTVCIAGDIFDTDQPSREERDLVQKKLIGYDQAGFCILLIPGNHDMSNMTGYTAIHYLSLLQDQGKFINSTITERTSYRLIDDTLFILLCHTPRKFKQDCNQAIQDVIDSSLKPNYKNIVLVVHETIKGSVTDTNFRLNKGDDTPKLEYGEDTEALNVSYVALGDIHIRQKLAPCTYYCGAPLQVKFGDQWPKGVLIVDTEDPDNPEFAAIESKQLIKVTAVEDIPTEDCYVKLATGKTDTLGVNLPDNVMKLQFVKQHDTDSLLSLDSNKSLHEIFMEELTKVLSEEDDLAIAKRELEAIINQLPKVDS